MRSIFAALVAFSFIVIPTAAHADFIIEGSAGSGYQVAPSIDIARRQPTNLMLAGGWGLGEWIRIEVGLAAGLGDVEGREFEFDVRPMLVVDPPLFPIYARAILGMSNVFNDGRAFAFGGAVGLGFSLGGIGIFAEAGMVPRVPEGEFVWIAEGRAGVYYLID